MIIFSGTINFMAWIIPKVILRYIQTSKMLSSFLRKQGEI
jgi:hypothetical protein